MAADPDIMTTVGYNGDPTDAAVAETPVIAKFAYGANDGDYTSGWTSLATADDVGSVWGLAYAPSAQKLYASTVVRRHNGLKGGTGDIYVIDLNSGTVSTFISLSAGSVPSNASRHLAGKTDPNHDPLFAEIAKVGLGDIDISPDEQTLYAMNLSDKKLYKINIAAGTVDASYAIGDPFGGCSEVRPWATKVATNGDVFVGSVCANDLSKGAAISKLTGAGFITVITMDMTYDRQYASSTSATSHTNWKRWTDDTDDIFGGTNYPRHPQPILSDLEIADDGSFVLGFLDRTGLEGGHKNYAPDSGDSKLYSPSSGGDIKRICKVGCFDSKQH